LNNRSDIKKRKVTTAKHSPAGIAGRANIHLYSPIYMVAEIRKTTTTTTTTERKKERNLIIAPVTSIL